MNFLCYGWTSTSAGGKPTPNENQTGNNQTGNAELPGSQEDSDNDYFSGKKSQLLWKTEDDRTNIIRREDNQLGKKECISLPDLIDFPSVPCQPALSPGITDILLLQIERENIIEQMKQVKEERRYLERIREELIKKVERLLEQGKLKRYHGKNYLIIEITEVQHAIDQLKRKLDTDKMKLITEIKVRKQAVSDLRTLKAELAQKKLNTSFQSQ
ncbi:hypothetical protein J1605_019324 [Eschrichtius robustus]|uniref:Spermatogenesis-associated protein 1 C-terminal domain-containing protein n=1 Tax=Eschrichtius robustus TaxID=9764 RepID=A0AB34HRM0_ESCRO|nr:hypothetical protein J1605_019324 [Eschrichtius robustus]